MISQLCHSNSLYYTCNQFLNVLLQFKKYLNVEDHLYCHIIKMFFLFFFFLSLSLSLSLSPEYDRTGNKFKRMFTERFPPS